MYNYNMYKCNKINSKIYITLVQLVQCMRISIVLKLRTFFICKTSSQLLTFYKNIFIGLNSCVIKHYNERETSWCLSQKWFLIQFLLLSFWVKYGYLWRAPRRQHAWNFVARLYMNKKVKKLFISFHILGLNIH